MDRNTTPLEVFKKEVFDSLYNDIHKDSSISESMYVDLCTSLVASQKSVLCNASIPKILAAITTGTVTDLADSELCALFLGSAIIHAVTQPNSVVIPSSIKSFGYSDLSDIIADFCSAYRFKNTLVNSFNFRSCDFSIYASKGYLSKDISLIANTLNPFDDQDELTDTSKFDSTVVLSTDYILDVYGKLFKSGYDLDTPKGILVKEGYVTICNNSIKLVKDSQLGILWDVIGGGFSYSDIDMRCFTSSEVLSGINYFPTFLLSIAYGMRVPGNSHSFSTYYKRLKSKDGSVENVHNWDVCKEYYRKVISSFISDLITETGDQSIVGTIQRALTNCVLVIDFNPATALKLRASNCAMLTENRIQSSLSSGKLFAGRGKVFGTKVVDSVTNMTVVFDNEAYSKYPIFAFQALDKLETSKKANISWRNVLLGKDIEDNMFSVNFCNDIFSTNIVAGSGSGKGVTTLNILASAYGNAIPVLYLDCKPDMSRTVHDLCKGKNVFAYDAQIPKWGSDYAGDNWKNTVPKEILEIQSGYSLFGALSYLKGMQLCLLLSKLRKPDFLEKFGLTKDALGGDRLVFIWDEYLAMCTNLNTALKELKTSIDIIYPDSRIRKESVEYNYYQKINLFVNGITNSLSNFQTEVGRMADVNVFILFQEVKGAKVDALDKFNLFKLPLESQNGASKLLGRGVSNAMVGTYNLKGTSEFSHIEEQRYFGYTRERQCDDVRKIKVFKPYLILNTTDESHKCMRTIREIEGIEKLIGSYGNARPDLGLEGYVQRMLGGTSSLDSVVTSSYTVVSNLLSLIGYEGTVEDFLYDFSVDSFQSVDSLLNDISEDDIDPSILMNSTYDGDFENDDFGDGLDDEYTELYNRVYKILSNILDSHPEFKKIIPDSNREIFAKTVTQSFF